MTSSCAQLKVHIMTLLLIKIVAIVLAASNNAGNSLRSYIKLTHIRCKASQPELMYFEVCQYERLENETKLATRCPINERPLTSVRLRLRCFRKQPGGYLPFVIDINLDWCEFLKHRNNELMQRLFKLLEQNSNLHTKCPIDIDYTFVNMSLPRTGSLRLPFKFPSGDYRIDIIMDANKAIQLTVNAFFKVEW